MKVFISSIVRGLEPFRDAAARAASVLRHDVSRAEDFSASPDSPRRVCLAAARDADVTILILGALYGDAQAAQALSATHEEYREARDQGRVLVFIQEGVTREPRQQDFLREVQEWSQGQFTNPFSTPEELRDAVTTALHDFELGRRAGVVDEAELSARARALVPDTRGFSTPTLAVVLAAGPRQSVLRPGELEAPELTKAIKKEALFGTAAVLDSEQGTSSEILKAQLLIEQQPASILLSELGDVRIVQDVQREPDGRNYMPVLIEEEVLEAAERALRFGAWLLDHIDPKGRITSVAPVAALTNAGHLGWLTRAEWGTGRTSVTMGMGGERIVAVALAPTVRARASLRPTARTIAEDFTVLLRRELKR